MTHSTEPDLNDWNDGCRTGGVSPEHEKEITDSESDSDCESANDTDPLSDSQKHESSEESSLSQESPSHKSGVCSHGIPFQGNILSLNDKLMSALGGDIEVGKVYEAAIKYTEKPGPPARTESSESERRRRKGGSPTVKDTKRSRGASRDMKRPLRSGAPAKNRSVPSKSPTSTRPTRSPGKSFRKSRSGGDLQMGESNNARSLISKSLDDFIGPDSDEDLKGQGGKLGTSRTRRSNDDLRSVCSKDRACGNKTFRHSVRKSGSADMLSSSTHSKARRISNARGGRTSYMSPLDVAAAAAASRRNSRMSQSSHKQDGKEEQKDSAMNMSNFSSIIDNLTKQIGELKADVNLRAKREEALQNEVEALRQQLAEKDELLQQQHQQAPQVGKFVQGGFNLCKNKMQKITQMKLQFPTKKAAFLKGQEVDSSDDELAITEDSALDRRKLMRKSHALNNSASTSSL